MMEQMVFPSMEAVAKLQDQKKILAAGLVAGERSLVFMIEAASHTELSFVLVSLPFWGLVKWDVTPLDPIRERAAEEQKGIDHLKQMLK
jgi:muconolactone delta-isomerase